MKTQSLHCCSPSLGDHQARFVECDNINTALLCQPDEPEYIIDHSGIISSRTKFELHMRCSKLQFESI